MSTQAVPSLFSRFLHALGFGVPLEPDANFAESLNLGYRGPLNVGRSVGECPLCVRPLDECDCQWSGQG